MLPQQIQNDVSIIHCVTKRDTLWANIVTVCDTLYHGNGFARSRLSFHSNSANSTVETHSLL